MAPLEEKAPIPAKTPGPGRDSDLPTDKSGSTDLPPDDVSGRAGSKQK